MTRKIKMAQVKSASEVASVPKVPDGRVVAGSDEGSGRLPGFSFGSTGGDATHTLAINEIPDHTHTGVTAAMNSNQSHHHTYDKAGVSLIGATLDVGAANRTISYTTTDTSSVDIDHTHNFETDSTGAGDPHNNVQPTIACRMIIKAH
jgi:microcystin-dependent protein